MQTWRDDSTRRRRPMVLAVIRHGISGGMVATVAIILAAVVYASLGSTPVAAMALVHHGSGLDAVMTFGQFTGLGHVAMYAAMAGAVLGLADDCRSRLVLLTAVACLGVGLELAQRLTAIRHFELADIAANGAGIGLAAVVWYIGQRRAVARRRIAA